MSASIKVATICLYASGVCAATHEFEKQKCHMHMRDGLAQRTHPMIGHSTSPINVGCVKSFGAVQVSRSLQRGNAAQQRLPPSALAQEKESPFQVEEFRTLNRCLDNSIADAVAEFSSRQSSVEAKRMASEANDRLEFLVHDLRNALEATDLSVRAIELGGLPLSGATDSMLKRNLASLRNLVDSSIAEACAARDPLLTSSRPPL
jgi:hypothetical protein